MPKKSKSSMLKIKKLAGEGVFDALKPIAKDVAPIAIDALSSLAKRKLSGGDIITDIAKQIVPMLLSGGQIRKLKKGGAITINPSMMSDSAETALSLLPQSAQKILKSLGQNKGVRYVLKQGEDLINRVSGKGIFDSLKSVGKEIAPIALDIGSSYAKKKLSGMGMRKKNVEMVGCGSPYVSVAYKNAMPNIENGGSIYPAGYRGGSIYPAGMSGGAVQLGSPYQHAGSPAMTPYFEAGNPFRYAPLQKRGGDIGSDILSGLSTAAKFAPLLGLL
jgi:hypothetical protein